MLFKTFKGEKCNRMNLISYMYANYEHVRLCFILVPLSGKIKMEPTKQDLGTF